MAATVRPLQVVSPAGELTGRTELGLEVTPQLCRDLLRRMRLARRFDEEALHLQRQGELGLWLMSWGQEAAQVGSISALRSTDHVFPSYREHAAALYRGIGPAELLAQWRGTRNSGWDPDRYRFHIYTLVLGAQLLHATGYAMGVQRDGADETVLVYFGDGASSEGDANEAFNWAAVYDVPLVFFCQNNQWAISTPTTAQMRAPLHQRGAGFGLQTRLVDGNDVLAVHTATRSAADAARRGDGPALIEAVTYRMGGHSTADDPTRYRTDAEHDEWVTRDPIVRIEALLARQGWTDGAFQTELDQECDDLAADTRRACRELPDPAVRDIFAGVLAEEPLALARERETYDVLQATLGEIE